MAKMEISNISPIRNSENKEFVQLSKEIQYALKQIEIHLQYLEDHKANN